jgi:hypothetical protein
MSMRNRATVLILLCSMFTDPASVEKRAVPGMRALRWERGYRVGVTHGASEGLGEIVDSFFGIINDATGNADGNTKKNQVVGGFKVGTFCRYAPELN